MKHTNGFLNLALECMPRVKQISAVEVVVLQKSGEPFFLVDVREDSEWAEGHVQGAIHIGRGVIERDIERIIPDHSARIVLYCSGGYRSAMAADNLQKMGYTNVFSLTDGCRAWMEQGFPRV